MKNINNIDINQRAKKAKENFLNGYNCAQSVFMAYADLFDIDQTLAYSLASGFGGGMGRLREVCGTCSGMFMIASLAVPADNVDREAKKTNYALIQDLAEDFRKANGSIICRELLGIEKKKEDPMPNERTKDYYKKRPCAELVYLAAEIVGKRLQNLNI